MTQGRIFKDDFEPQSATSRGLYCGKKEPPPRTPPGPTMRGMVTTLKLTGHDRSGRPMTLLDAHGRPLRVEELHKDSGQAVPTAFTYSGIVRGQLDPDAPVGRGDAGQSRARPRHRRDPYPMLLLHERKEATAGLKWHVEPDNSRPVAEGGVGGPVEDRAGHAQPPAAQILPAGGPVYGRYASS